MRPERRLKGRNGKGRPHRRPKLKPRPSSDLSLLTPKNGLDKGVHIKHYIWLRFALIRGDLNRLNLGQSEFLKRTQMNKGWHRIEAPARASQEEIWFEQITPTGYSPGWLPNAVPSLVDSFRRDVWQTILASSPYRTYYLFAPPPSERPYVLPQLASLYAVIYYFGSITRYRPHHFDQIVSGPYGPFVESFIQDSPAQIAYLFASEFAQREVSRAALV